MAAADAPSSYSARFARMWRVCGPGAWRFILASDADAARARAAVAAGAAPGACARARAAAAEGARLLDAATHPDTGALIAVPLRMAAHVPANALLLAAMLAARSPAASAAAQAANASFNAAQCEARVGGVRGGCSCARRALSPPLPPPVYANRHASNTVPDATLAASFAAALLASAGVAAAGAAGAARAAASAARAADARGAARAARAAAAVPFLAAAAGKPLQIGCMRADEFAGAGVVVRDARGAEAGRSRRAGALAVAATVATRVLYLAPMLWMPAAQAALERALLPARAGALPRAALFVAHAAVNSAVVTPACIALFDQRATVRADWLEAPLAARGGEVLEYNKGL